MWLGSMDPLTRRMFVIGEDKIEYRDVTYIPAFRKIIDEILDNAIDALIEHSNASGNIRVKIDDERVLIEDDGVGIPVVKKKLSETELKNLPADEAKRVADTYIPHIAWTRLFSGTNFQDSAEKFTLGSHGVGSKAAAIFSTKFIGKTDDGKKSCVVKAVNNLETSTCKVAESSGTSGTSVEFWPDLAKFKLKKIDQVYADLLYQRLLCLGITFPKIKFNFNGKRINVNDKKFLKMFSEHIEFATFDKGFIGVFPNDQDDFNFFTYVNGMHMTRGGAHIEFIANNVVAPIREKLAKKYKTIKPADIRNRFTLVAFMRDFANPKFDSQTKETLTNSWADVSAYLGDKIDFEQLAKQVLKNEALINPIVETFKIKEELKARQELKQAKKIRVKSDKYFPGEGDKKYLFLVEGLSAAAGLMKCLGRKEKYYYALRGLALNAYSASIQKISANQEVKEVLNILNLDVSKPETVDSIEFQKIVISCDADLDGANISSMLFGWWKRLAPELYAKHKVYRLNTPVVVLKDTKDKVQKWFFTVDAFKAWEKANPNSKLKVIYLKGLGSLEIDDLKYIISQTPGGFDGLLDEFGLDSESDQLFEDWLGDNAEPRKKYLNEYTFDMDML